MAQTAESQLASLLESQGFSVDIESELREAAHEKTKQVESEILSKEDGELQLAFSRQDEIKRTHRHKLQPKDRQLISYCEKYYHLNRGQFPSVAEIAFNCKMSQSRVKYILQNDNVQESFVRRGITSWDTTVDSTYLSPEQIGCAVSVANFADTRTVSAKLDELGVTPSQYYAWLNNPAYKEFVRSLADQSLENSHHEAIGAFIKLVRNGDLGAIKYYFEITGYADSSDAVNLKLAVQRVIEAVQRHVKDPVTLANIALDIQGAAPVASSVPVRLEIEDQSLENRHGIQSTG